MLRQTVLTGLLLVLAGCSGAPPGYVLVEALVEPADRPVAIVPFTSRRAKTFDVRDGIKLAELAAVQLRSALPGVTVFGPSAMRESINRGLNEARWYEIGREVRAELLLVGQITFFETYHDKLRRSREGTIGLSFRVLDVSRFPPKKLTSGTWLFGFPEDVGAKFEARYEVMDDATFRDEVLQFAARQLAGIFYDHYKERRLVESRLDVRWHKE